MDDFEIDPDLAAQMGFSAFGATEDKAKRPNKRAKHNHNGAGSPPQSSATAANNVPLGSRPAAATTTTDGTDVQVKAAESTGQAQADPETVAEIEDGAGGMSEGTNHASHGQFRGSGRGGKGGHVGRQSDRGSYQKTNESGDAVYFDPSFIEDPWEGLQPKRWGER